MLPDPIHNPKGTKNDRQHARNATLQGGLKLEDCDKPSINLRHGLALCLSKSVSQMQNECSYSNDYKQPRKP